MIDKKIEKKAQEVLEELGIKTLPISLDQILESNKIQIRTAPSQEFSGLLFRKKDGQVIIGINTKEDYSRQRFTIAHELGHFFLDSKKDAFVDRTNVISFRDNQSDHIKRSPGEIRANKFAAALIMPADFLKKDFQQIVKTDRIFLEEHLEALANRYMVSKKAMKVRLSSLSLIKLSI